MMTPNLFLVLVAGLLLAWFAPDVVIVAALAAGVIAVAAKVRH